MGTRSQVTSKAVRFSANAHTSESDMGTRTRFTGED